MQRGGIYWISMRRAGERTYSGCELTRVPRETSVLTSSPGMPLLNKRRQWTVIVSRCCSAKRFMLANSPSCACAPDKIQDLLHVLEERLIFVKERAEIEVGMGVRILRENFPTS
ncbi:hypothetical protein EVAR_41493_1 [Eumeta japonica]|uniref:Uncharacterized protein n=1 Tax=Eumeta variegata TaxID=151549 RepID=A0A4C1X3I9_EUMVA|nr:hypothetical protein EVAR_41493_1 [Eumeta japonica]